MRYIFIAVVCMTICSQDLWSVKKFDKPEDATWFLASGAFYGKKISETDAQQAIDDGADVNALETVLGDVAKGGTQRPLISTAIYNGETGIFNALIKSKNINLGIGNVDGKTPLAYIVENIDLGEPYTTYFKKMLASDKLTSAIIHQSTTKGTNPLGMALELADLSIAAIPLIRSDKYPKKLLNSPDKDGKSPFYHLFNYASKGDPLTKLDTLLNEAKIDVNALGTDGESILYYALLCFSNWPDKFTSEEKQKILKRILEDKNITEKTVNRQPNTDYSPFKLALDTKNIELVKILTENNKFDINGLDDKKNTPLHIVLSTLVGDPNLFKDEEKHTLLKLVLENPKATKETVNNPNKYNATPLTIALDIGNTQLVKDIIEDPKFDVNRIDDLGRTPLHEVLDTFSKLSNQFKGDDQQTILKMILGNKKLTKETLNHRDNSKLTPLELTTIQNNVVLTKAILKDPKFDKKTVDRSTRVAIEKLIEKESETEKKELMDLISKPVKKKKKPVISSTKPSEEKPSNVLSAKTDPLLPPYLQKLSTAIATLAKNLQ